MVNAFVAVVIYEWLGLANSHIACQWHQYGLGRALAFGVVVLLVGGLSSVVAGDADG